MALEFYTYRKNAVVSGFSGDEKFVVIPKVHNGVPVTEILESVFADTRVEGVIVPPTLQSIRAGAFSHCYWLRYIGMQEALDGAPEADGDTLTLEDMLPERSILPSALQSVGVEAFTGTALKWVEFEGVYVELEDAVFQGCKELETVKFPNAEKLTFGKRMFLDSSIEAFHAPKTRFNVVPEYTFANCAELTTVETRISGVGARSFYGCGKLKKLNTPQRLRTTGREAFSGCYQLEKFGKPDTLAEWNKALLEMGRLFAEETERLKGPELKQARTALVQTLARVVEKKGETEMNEIDTLLTEKGGPLLRMRVDYHGSPPKEIPIRIKGMVGKEESGYHFRIQVPASLAGVGLRVLKGRCLNQMSTLLNYIIKKGMQVVLLGRQEGNVYTVYQIIPVQRGLDNDISPGLFAEMVRRLKRADVGTVEPNVMPQFFMDSDDDQSVYMEVVGPRLPAWVVAAYERNKRASKKYSMDERRHAQRAMEYLSDIDWFPYVVKVPPAKEIRQILDRYFYGMDALKEKAEEIAALIMRSLCLPKFGILLVGEPGTGKTRFARAFAEILSMGIILLDMSTLGDDPDIVSGTDRIYSNARPGRILESMHQNRSSTGVLLVNELDKAGNSKGGRYVADMLLSILDKSGVFYENYLQENIPVDNLFCIATCNSLSDISAPLRDRFIVVQMPDYSPDEKAVIFKDYVLPDVMKASNIAPEELEVEDEAIALLASEYALEAGARQMEQFAQSFAGHFARAAENTGIMKRVYTAEDVRTLFGPGKRIQRNFAVHPGEVNAAFYFEGKAYFFLIEASVFPGTGNLEILGPIGERQRDYCKVAYWCVRNTINASHFDLSKYDVKIFVPSPIPDGVKNHLGLACYAAICSKILNRSLALDDTCFIGGCDLNGSLYFDQSDLNPLLRAMKARGVSTVYAPMGTNQLVDTRVSDDCNITIVEGLDAATLFGLAIAASNGY